MDSFLSVSSSRMCILYLVLLSCLKVQAHSNSEVMKGTCLAGEGSTPCIVNGEKQKYNSQMEASFTQESRSEAVNEDVSKTDSVFHGSMQELETILDAMSSSKDQMMSDLTVKMSEVRKKMMEALDSMMDRMSESRTSMMAGLDTMMQRVVRSKQQMVAGLDSVLDNVAHSRMVEEIDQLVEMVKQSKVMQELRALPQEIRQSFILSARNRSYIYAGVMVAIAAAILFSGAIYYAWCHHDAWSYYIGTIEEAKALLLQAKEASFMSHSRSSSQDLSEETSDTSSTASQNGDSLGDSEEAPLLPAGDEISQDTNKEVPLLPAGDKISQGMSKEVPLLPGGDKASEDRDNINIAQETNRGVGKDLSDCVLTKGSSDDCAEADDCLDDVFIEPKRTI